MEEFPSPHGDKFQRLYGWNFDVYAMFPSPHGDKFQRLYMVDEDKIPSRFRPLTGINFNPTLQRVRGERIVSVPSRG